VFGKQTHVQTDHKPLETIFRKSILKSPKRLQRMLLQLQRFDLIVRYKPGRELSIADALSRDYESTKFPNTDDVNENIFAVFQEIEADVDQDLPVQS